MNIEGILALVFIFGIPSVALATHLVLRPLVRDIATAIRGSQDQMRDDLEARVERLEDVVYDIDRQVTRLVEAERFRRALESEPARSVETEARTGEPTA